MNSFKYKYLLSIPLSFFLLTQAIASSFTMQKLDFINWGNGAKQVALIHAAPLNLGPPSIDQSGESLYILDAVHQRLLLVNTDTKQLSTINYHAPDASDFCVTKSGNFALLFADARQVVTYNSSGRRVQTQQISNAITPLSIFCSNQNWIVEAFEGGFYSANAELLRKRPFGNYRIVVELINSSQAKIQVSDNQANYRFYVKALSGEKLVFIDVIGTDSVGNVFVVLEESRGKQLNRYLRKYTKTGKLLASSILPYSVYTYTLKDLAVSASGEVYQMVAHKDALKLVKWQTTGLRSRTSSRLLRDLFSYSNDNPNDFEASEAPSGMTRSRGISAPPRSRATMMQTAKKYANFRFTVKSKNISQGKYLGGKKVVTPIRNSGFYKGVPYKWGGFDSLASFQKGLKAGKKAGDICASHCSGKHWGSAAAVGVDCSGFVSRVWGLSSHQGTSYLPRLSYKIRYGQLKSGDILNRDGRHVMLFVKRGKRGQFYVYEAVAGKVGKVAKRVHNYRYVKNYTPRRYQKIVDNSIPLKKQGKLKRLVIHGTTRLTSGQNPVYRAIVLYSSDERRDVTDEVIWTETSSHAKFRQSQLKTKPVTKNEEFFVLAKYTENGEVVRAGIRVIMQAFKASKSTTISLDFAAIYRQSQSSTEFKRLKNGSRLHSGNYYKLIFSPRATTYVYIYQRDAAGDIYQLFPYKGNGNPTRIGNTYFAPNQAEWFYLDNTIGKERIYLIASKQADKALERQYKLVKIARANHNYAQLRTTQKKLKQMLISRLKSEDRGVGGTISGQLRGLFNWKEYGTWLSAKRHGIKIKGGVSWYFQHK